MITIRCVKCREKVFKYKKIGEGRILRCHYTKIKDDYSVRDGDEVKCAKCGNIIGTAESTRVKMNRNAFSRHGSISRK